MNAIILGCGRTGAELAQNLEAQGINVTIIDNDVEAFSKLENFKGNLKLGNGTDIDVLKSAGIESADLFACVAHEDNTNLMAAQIAKAIFGVKKVACRIYDSRLAAIYSDLGLDTVSITTIGAGMLSNLLMGSRTLKRFQLGDGSGVAIEIKLGQNMDGKTIADLEVPGEFKPAAVVRGLKVIIPDKDFVLNTDDHIFGVAITDKIKQLEQRVCPSKSETGTTSGNTGTPKGEKSCLS